MKNILRLFVLFAAAGLLVSCLDENPKYTQNADIIFSKESNAELALLGCYGQMTQANAYGSYWQEVPLAGCGVSWEHHDGSDLDDLASFNVSLANSELSYAWQGMYKVIAEVNGFIESMEASELSDEAKAQDIGEARFLRGLAYYNLVSHFGDVPLKLTASTADGIALPRTDREEVFAAIIEDLEFAIDNIASTSTLGRANSWTAKAMLGKVYYKMAMLGIDETTNLNNAKTYFDDVYDNGPYALEQNYAGLFAPYTSDIYVTNSKETIIQFNINSNSTVCFNRASNRFAPPSATSGITWGTNRVNRYWYDYHRAKYPGDPRMETNYITHWRYRSGNSQSSPVAMIGSELAAGDSVYVYPYRALYDHTDSTLILEMPYEICADPANPARAECEALDEDYVINRYSPRYGDRISKNAATLTKNVDSLWNFFASGGNGNKWPYYGKMFDQETAIGTYSNCHILVYRYAEMLLLMADVYNELGQTSRAVELANQVLTRARNITTPAASEPADWPTSLSKDEVTERLYFERLIEMCGEPNAYDMTRIRGKEYLEKLCLICNNHPMTVYSDALYHVDVQSFMDRVFNNGETVTMDPSFMEKSMLLPIPSSEIDANDAITNADNNPGY
ncbi:MAG: RagB/SusD family nutrient uptake outer membrane protein [Bacteroidales bacterium]|nr:RagB/SusD family nutrient uptake outer membrane protein [Bacteroidales bacterium]